MNNTIRLPHYVVNQEYDFLPFSETFDWGIVDLSIKEIHDMGFTGKGKKIGVVDTGVQENHEDLDIKGFKNFTNSATPFDEVGHGTHVAGIIGARSNAKGVLGVSPDSDVYSYKALGSNSGEMSWVENALEAALNDDMDIINLSLGGSGASQRLIDICKAAYNAGKWVIAASGNSGRNEHFYPASLDTVIASGATDNTRNIAYFTTYGEQLDVVAPGAKILSTYIGNKYAVLSGTSMACPFVSGAVALMLSANVPNDREIVLSSVIDLGPVGFDIKSGHGLINPIKAIQIQQNCHKKVEGCSDPKNISKVFSKIFSFWK